jgi:putative nucleotidyltransferase with HDIG domain
MTPAPKAPFFKAADFMQRSDVWSRIGLCALTTGILYFVMFGWEPPFAYRIRQAPLRDLHANTLFEYQDAKATLEKRDRTRRNFKNFYENDSQKITIIREELINDVFSIIQQEWGEVENSDLWSKFFEVDANTTEATAADEESFNLFRESLSADKELEKLKTSLDLALLDIKQKGLLIELSHQSVDGSVEQIQVYPLGNLAASEVIKIEEVRIAEVTDELQKRLSEKLSNESETITDPTLVSDRIFSWLKRKLPETLSWDEGRSKTERDIAVNAVKTAMKQINPSDPLKSDTFDILSLDSVGIMAGVPLELDDINLLKKEHQARIASGSIQDKLIRSTMFFGLFAAIFSMFCQYLFYRDRHLLDDLKQFSILLGLMLVTLTLAWVVTINIAWRAEIIPITIFAMTIAIVYHIELAMLVATLVALAYTVAHGFGLSEFVILTASSSSAALMCRVIRSRTKLVNVGVIVASIVFPTAIGVNYLLGQPLSLTLAAEALWFAGGAGVAGLMMTALLPFLERLFDIQTDISLLELSDANHPLLKELVQRAPGTYNHSINVASMSEAAADSIGANGLLCRVGAYFHDVGKLRKPEYFIENQGGGPNKHDDLTPSMSTLVILAHVKDGIEIGRKHRLPQRIINLIEQHHGTTLIEYFYQRAMKLLEESGDEEAISNLDESDFRYPGPHPQTPEAAVMMLADTVESACRVLREPAPARIESLVRDITKKKFDDGQFEDCDITIKQLNTIQESLIKSLNAMYHARIKYPESQTAPAT